MRNIQKILVGLDRTEMDRDLVRYALFMGKLLRASTVRFVHVQHIDNQDSRNLKSDIDLNENSEEACRKWLDELIAESDQPVGQMDTSFAYLEGQPLYQLLHYIRDGDFDLVLVGSKKHSDGSGILPARLTRKSPCSVAFVPPNPSMELKRILIPTDYSAYNAMAFREMAFFRDAFPKVELYAQHVFTVPLGYYKTGKSYEEFAEIMRENSKKLFADFVRDYNLEHLHLIDKHTLDDDQNPADKIMAMAHHVGADLIVLGSKGHTRASTILLGSTAEKVLRMERAVPLVILKEKGETLSALEILLKI
jgi:nucleotide-binding universal stress UspA family protein